MARPSFKCLTAGAALVIAGVMADGASAQEHSYSPADIEAGQALYRANCLGCHGNGGDAVDGADLSTGRFRHGSSDDDLIGIIRNGIAGTPMTPHRHLSSDQTGALVAFLRSLPAGGPLDADERDVRIGDAERGRELYYGEGDCADCHGINGGGNLLSPDLGTIGTRRSPATLEQAVLAPNAESRPEYRFYRVVTRDGREVVGRLMNQDTHSVQLMDESQALVSYLKSDLREHGFAGSPMPAYRDRLNPDQVADLVAWLLTLQEEPRGEASQ